jgi:Carboxypeptidase regulatory-like domain
VAPIRLLAVLTLALCVARPSHAQADRGGRIDGTVTDSVRARPLAGVRVVAVGVQSPDVMRGAAITDSAGRYHIDALPAGRYMVGFESPLLDSLEIALPGRAAEVAPGGSAAVNLAVPPAAKLRAAVCSGAALPSGTGAVYGHVVSAESESPLSDAVIALAWWERTVDRTTLRSDSHLRTASVSTDDGGWYRVCGVPTDTWLSVQLQHEGRTAPVIRTIVDDTLGIAIRHLSFSPSGSHADADSGAVDASGGDALLSGTAVLGGVIRGTGDAPLASAEVRVRGTGAVGHTDASGRYSLGGLPAGTQVLDVRRIGYGAAETSVELRSGIVVTRDLRLQRIVNLDSIRVVARRSRYVEFDRALNRKSLGAYFLGPEELEQMRFAMTSDIIWRIPGFRVVGNGADAIVVSALSGSLRQCSANIVVNGAPNQPINDVNPLNVGAIAAYPHGGGFSQISEYDTRSGGHCGLILIWTKR